MSHCRLNRREDNRNKANISRRVSPTPKRDHNVQFGRKQYQQVYQENNGRHVEDVDILS